MFAGLPLLGLLLTEVETDRIMRITPVRDAAGELTRSTTALRTTVRHYELSGAFANAPDPRISIEVQGDLSDTQRKANALSALAGTEPALSESAVALIAATEHYLEVLQPTIEAIRDSTLTPTISERSNTANAELGSAAEAFFGEESRLTSNRFSTLHQKERLSLALTSVSAAGIFAVLLIFGLRRLRSLRSKLAVAEELSEAREEMVNLASHELRNPLSIISLSAEMLEAQAVETGDEDLADSAREVHVAALRADALVAELLDLSRLDANRLRLNLQPVAIGPLLQDAIDITARHRGSRSVEVSMETEITGVVVADSARLSIVLRNLVDNAFKYSGDGSPVNVSIENRGRQMEIDVYDKGPGVPKGESDLVFSRFNRLQQTSHVGGVGIGMYLSRELARRMGGDLRAFDGEARGHFRLTLNSPISKE